MATKESTDIPTIPPVVGINFGNAYSSIAVFTKEGLAECIANEDGERQIACALAFHGEQIYIGNQAKQQLVKNSKNTITGFRNLLGKKFSEIQQNQPLISAPVIQHPDIADEPAYVVDVLQPAPKPLAKTPVNSAAPTPQSEPTPTTRTITVSEVTTIFLKSLLQSAEDFLGKKVEGAVITTPPNFTDAQKAALEKAANNAGIKVLQLLEEVAATVTSADAGDRTTLVVDVGAGSLSLSLLSMRNGLSFVLASSFTQSIGGDQIDDKLIKFFATDFVKKSKTPLTVCPSTDPLDKRAEAKLRLAIEHTKRTLSASPGVATCSVESLKEGIDFTGSINRMRFDIIAKPVYAAVSNAVLALLSEAQLDAFQINEIIYVGGTTCLPGLDENICSAGGFHEEVNTPFSLGTVVGGGVGDPTTILSRGCAVHASLLATLSALSENDDSAAIANAFHDSSSSEVKVTSRTINLLFPDDAEGTWVTGILAETPLPARRIVPFEIALTDASKRIAFEVWEVKEGVRIEKVKPLPLEDEGGEEEEEEEEEVKHLTITKEKLLGAVESEAKLGIKNKVKGTWLTAVEAVFVVTSEGSLQISLKEVGKDGTTISLSIPSS